MLSETTYKHRCHNNQSLPLRATRRNPLDRAGQSESTHFLVSDTRRKRYRYLPNGNPTFYNKLESFEYVALVKMEQKFTSRQ